MTRSGILSLLIVLLLVPACSEDSPSQPNPWLLDGPGVVPMSREGWWWASLPAEFDAGATVRRFGPEDRAYARWYRPSNPSVTREDLNPTLSDQEGRDIVPAIELRMEAPTDATAWSEELYTGLMRGYAFELDLSEAQFLEFWVNDFTGQTATSSEGVLHFDFGYMNEDFFWKTEFDPGIQADVLIQGEWDTEDLDHDWVLLAEEDTGLDGIASGRESTPQSPYQNLSSFVDDQGADDFSSAEEDGNNRFPRINGLESNQRLDTEDINQSGALDFSDGYFTLELPLDDTEHILVDVNEDYPDYMPEDERKKNNSWRKVRLDLDERLIRQAHPEEAPLFHSREPELSKIRYFRIWYEVPGGSQQTVHTLQFAQMRFVLAP